MTAFIEQTAATIAERLSVIEDEIARLTQARDILSPTAPRTNGKNGALTARQVQALSLIESKPGITAAELSRALGGTYGYQVVKRLQHAGQIEPCGEGWQPA